MAQIIVDTPTHYETDFIKITYVPEKKRFEEVWKEYAEDEDIQLAKLREIEILKSFKIDTYLSDMLSFKGASPEIQLWVNEVWFKLAFEAGLRKLAMILPPDIYAVFSLENAISGEFAMKLQAGKFENFFECDLWLNNLNNV